MTTSRLVCLSWVPSNWIRAAVLAVVCLPLLLSAQVSTTGKITGVVTDASGAVVPNATVEVNSPALMVPRSTKTHSDGSFLFDLLPPGPYELGVTAGGFQTVKRTNIVLTAGFTATVSSQLTGGELRETIELENEPAADGQTVERSEEHTSELQ